MRATSDTAAEVRDQAGLGSNAFDLVAYAKRHRYRLRNLHDGNPVPPAVSREPCDASRGHRGENDRWDAIVGHRGYVAMDGSDLAVCVFYRSSRGVSQAVARLRDIGARVDQVGDTEVGATIAPARIDKVMDLIKVSKLRPGDVSRFSPPTERLHGPE